MNNKPTKSNIRLHLFKRKLFLFKNICEHEQKARKDKTYKKNKPYSNIHESKHLLSSILTC